MKTTLIAALSLISSSVFAGPEPAPTPNVDVTKFAEDVFKAGNITLAVSPGYAPKLGAGEWGLAVIAGYQVNQFLGTFIRGDLMDNNFYVASGSATFQVPIKIKDKLFFRPLAEVGVGSVLGGQTDKKQEVFAIAGGGGMLDYQINDHWRVGVGGVAETWEPVYHGVTMYRGIIGATYTF